MSCGTLLLGASGQVGSALTPLLRACGALRTATRRDVELSDGSALRALLEQAAPDLVINAAAYTAVDRAEEDQAAAWAVNAVLPRVLADWCHEHGAHLLHFSSDYVFGTGPDDGRPHLEAEPVDPKSFYGRSKAEGDEAILASRASAIVLRTSWVYSATHPCFLTTIARLARERETLQVVDDQIGTPTPASWLARTSIALIDAHMPEKPELVNCVPAGWTSWHGFAQAIVDGLQRRGVTLAVREVQPCSSEAFPRPAPRPRNSRLDTGKLAARLGPQQDWRLVLEPELELYANGLIV